MRPIPFAPGCLPAFLPPDGLSDVPDASSAGALVVSPGAEAGALSAFEVGVAGVFSRVDGGGDGAARFGLAAQGARVDGGFELLLDDWLS